MLQYITNTASPISVIDQVAAVLEGGCRWIQINMKDASDAEVSRVVDTIKPLCIKDEAFLILDDRLELAKELNVGGVYLTKSDITPGKARAVLGPAAVVGKSANSFDDVKRVFGIDIDYIGIGPFASADGNETSSDKTLGLEGIREICNDMKSHEINLAHVAIGGIRLEDVNPLLDAGCNGIAVSSAIAFADDPVAATKEFIALMPIGA